MRQLSTLLALLAIVVTACTTAVTPRPNPSPTLAGSPPRGVFASSLYQVGSCDELLEYLIDHAVDLVGPYGLPGAGLGFFGVAEDATATTAAAAEAARTYTGTNNQVVGVDEADVVKTDGNRIFAFLDGVLRVALVTDSGAEMAGSLRLDWWPQAMLLHRDTLLLIGGASWGGPVPLPAAREGIAPTFGSSTVRVAEVDVSDPARPAVVRTLDLDGTYIDARLVDGVARIAITSMPVGFEWEFPKGSGLRAEREATEANRRLVRGSTLDNWLPYFVLSDERTGTQAEGRLLDCTNVMAPGQFAGLNILSLLTFDLTQGIGSWAHAGVVATGATMYATPDHTYLATQPWVDWAILTEAGAREATRDHRTQIHLFETIDPGAPRYLGSGEVEGFLLDQFAMDEHAGHLRVASTTAPEGWGWSDGSESLVTVLARSDDRLVETGEVGGLGRGEQIYSVRFLGDVGYVVTFRQTDPLYTLDLRDPADPHVAGELKILGYSAYLHPVGEGRLLGLGQDADEQGRVKGTQLSLFDVTDPASPTRIAQVTLDGGWSQAEGDHHAFTYFDGLALAPYERWEWAETEGGSEAFDTGVLAVRVGDGSLELAGILRPLHDEPLSSKDLWPIEPWLTVPMRTMVIDDKIYTVTAGGLAVHSVASLDRITFVEF
jgi:hypothetical protein